MWFRKSYLRAAAFTAVIGHGLLANASPLIARQQAGGYLAAVFKGDVPSVFFLLAEPSQPTTFTALNRNAPSLVPTQGTRGARDPFVLATHDNSKLYVLATDLDIGKTNWGAAQATGSRSIFIWDSSDGVNWSGDRLVELMPPTAGYVWAPSATWDVDANAYAVFWSSRIYSESDTQHTGAFTGPFIFYSHTTDFQSFSSPQRWNPDTKDIVIDQEIQFVKDRTYVRYLKLEGTTNRVILERSDTGLFGTWTRVGVPYDANREGPASYQDILNPARYYLLEDNYGGPGYECYYTETFEVPYTPCQPGVTPSGMRHGGVVQLDSTRYAALSKNVTGG